MAPLSKVVRLFQYYPLLLLILLHTASAITNRLPKSAFASRKPVLSFGGRTRNITRPPLSSDYKTYYFTQSLDHFNHESEGSGTFKQKFVMNRKYWVANSTSPILVYLGSEGPLDVESAGFVNDHCQNMSGLCVYIEHRFYGDSRPLASMTDFLNNDTLRGFFNPAQALADYAEIIQYIKRVFAAPFAPVLMFGSSYAGMLSAWFRLKFPHMAIGAVASSAPIFYFDKGISPYGYDEIIAQDYRNVSENCFQTIRDSWAEIDKVANETNGLVNLSRQFRTCSPLNKSSELKEFLVSMYSYAAQYDDPPSYPVSTICGGIDAASKETSDLLSLVFAGMSSYMGDNKCYDMNYFDTPSETSKGWEWLACSEIMMHIAQGGNETLFPGNHRFQLGRYRRRCKNTYNVTSAPYWIETFYGGLDNKLALKRFGNSLIFTNGLKDPYSYAGVVKDINDGIVALTTVNGSHGLDMLPAQDTDPDWLVEQRSNISSIMQGWLTTYFADLKEYLEEK